ncbi:hypothetical protein ACQJBY_021811 [Aegilops geniculata]
MLSRQPRSPPAPHDPPPRSSQPAAPPLATRTIPNHAPPLATRTAPPPTARSRLSRRSVQAAARPRQQRSSQPPPKNRVPPPQNCRRGPHPGSATTMAATSKVRQGGEALLARPAATTKAVGCRWAQPGGGRPGGNPSVHRWQTWPTRPSLCGGRSSTMRWGYRDYDEEEDEEGEGRSLGGHGRAGPCPSRPLASSSTTRAGASLPPPSTSSPSSGALHSILGRCIAAASKHIVTILRCSTFSFGPVHRCRLQVQAHCHHPQIDGANNRPL